MRNLDPLVALEIGTTRVRVAVGDQLEDGSIMISGMGACDARGIRKSEVTDFDNALACVRTALAAAEDSADVTISQVHLALSGGHIGSLMSSGSVPVMGPDGEITQADVEAAMANARAVKLPPERQMLHSIGQRFRIDDQSIVTQPVGMEAGKLTVDMLILHAVRNRLRNLVKLVKSAQAEVADIAFGGLCAALAVLAPEEKEGGVLVLDLGGGTTDYLAYAENAIAHAGVLAVGGDHVTNDLAQGLHIGLLEAERLKRRWGDVAIDLAMRGRRIGLPAESGARERSVSAADFNTIVRLRMEETLALVRRDLEACGLLGSLGSGVVLTGGGSRLRNLVGLTERVLGLPCRVGRARNYAGVADVLEAPEFAPALGMLRYGFRSGGRDHAGGHLFGWLRRKLVRA